MSANGWTRLSERAYTQRYDPEDVTIGALAGRSGVVLVDTRNSPEEAEELHADVAAYFGMPVVAVINTHAHYDHTFGNQYFHQSSIPIYGHARIPAHFQAYERLELARELGQGPEESLRGWENVVLTAPTVLVAEPTSVKLAGVRIELHPLGHGHTDTDLALHLPDDGLWFVGDVVEESGPPMFGSGANPLGWGRVLDSLTALIEPHEVVVPGHGMAVNRNFVAAQAVAHHALGRELAAAYAAGIGLEAIDYSPLVRRWWPPDFLHTAAQDAYDLLQSRSG